MNIMSCLYLTESGWTMARKVRLCAAVLLSLAAPSVLDFAGQASLQRRSFSQRTAIVEQTVAKDINFDVIPKSHIHGALQRVLGRDVYKSETPFFYRTSERQDFYHGLVRFPALPKKNPDGSNYIPARLFHYVSGKGATYEDAENDAYRKALLIIRKADSEIARWPSWRATTSQQALDAAAAEIADMRDTDGNARSKLSRALAVVLGRVIKQKDFAYFMLEDPNTYHVALRLPWPGAHQGERTRQGKLD